MKTINEINKPEVTTYFIVYQDESTFAYGEVSPNQQMTTGQPYLYQTTDLSEYELKLKEFNINLNEEEE